MRFVVIRFSSLGDIVQTTAFLNKLKGLFPKSHITYVTKERFKEILDGQPFVDRVVALKRGQSIFELAKEIEKPHCVFDLHVNIRSVLLSSLLNPVCLKRVKKNTIYRYALVLKNETLKQLFMRKSIDNIEEQLKLLGVNVDTKDARPVLYVKNTKKEPKAVGFAVGAKWKTKMWPKEYFRELAKMLTKDGYNVWLFGSKDEAEIADFVGRGLDGVESFVGRLSLKGTIEEMSKCIGFVSNDSGLMHVASALDIPLVAIFGPTVRGFGFYPRGRSVVLEKDISCRPCSLHGTDSCKKGTLECLYSIEPREVYSALIGLLSHD